MKNFGLRITFCDADVYSPNLSSKYPSGQLSIMDNCPINADFIVNWLKEHGIEGREDVIDLLTKLEGNSITLLIAYRIGIEKKPQLSKSVHDYIVKKVYQ